MQINTGNCHAILYIVKPIRAFKAIFATLILLTFVNNCMAMVKKEVEKVRHNRIKIVLAEKNLEQKDLVTLTGLSRTTISNYCTNYAQPSLETLRMIASVLKVNAQILVEPTPDEADQ